MKKEEFREKVYEICDKKSIDKSLFYIASICNGENIIYDFRSKKEGITEMFIIRYFSKYNVVVIWKKDDHKLRTRKMSLDKKKFNKCINEKINVAKKGIEYPSRKLTNTYVSSLEDLEEIILKCIK